MFVLLEISIPKGLSLKDPLESKLGRNMAPTRPICTDILRTNTFYCSILLYGIGFAINSKNITEPNRKMDTIIDNFVHPTEENPSVDIVNKKILHRIIINEWTHQ